MKTIALPIACDTNDTETFDASESEHNLFLDELIDFIINDFIKRHIFRSFKSYSFIKIIYILPQMMMRKWRNMMDQD